MLFPIKEESHYRPLIEKGEKKARLKKRHLPILNSLTPIIHERSSCVSEVFAFNPFAISSAPISPMSLTIKNEQQMKSEYEYRRD